jgi:sigma-E factor negative regulatory protein RseA
MSQHQEELLSALFDGETSEFETRRILQELDSDAKARWQRYQMISDASNKRLDSSFLCIDVSAAVSVAIAAETTPALANDSVSATSTSAGIQRWLKPAVGFAAAASIAFVTVLTVQQSPDAMLSPFVAEGNVSASQLNIKSNVGLSTVSGSATTNVLMPAEQTNLESQRRREQQRLDAYMLKHTQQSTFNNGQGLLPMVRTAAEDTQ